MLPLDAVEGTMGFTPNEDGNLFDSLMLLPPNTNAGFASVIKGALSADSGCFFSTISAAFSGDDS
jgi:hypothetical protein